MGVTPYSQVQYEFNVTHDTIAIRSKEMMDYEYAAKWMGMYLLQAKGDYARARSYALKYLLALNRSIFSPLNTQAKTIHDENVLF